MSSSTAANAGTANNPQWTKMPSLASAHQAGTRPLRLVMSVVISLPKPGDGTAAARPTLRVR